MSTSTHGRIKGYIRYEEILNFIRQKWDEHAESEIRKEIISPISECNWKFEMNKHSEDSENWYSVYGFIYFQYHNQNIQLFYDYDNLKHLKDIEDYLEYGLEDMVNAETTYLSLSHSETHIEMMKELITHFGGGWIDENDCDDIPYYYLSLNPDETILPIHYVTMEEVYEKFGHVVVIKDK